MVPEPDAVRSYGYESSSLSNLIRASNNVWSFGPSLAETLFNAGATYAQTKEERALYDSAVVSYRETVLTAFQQVENDLATLRHLETEYAQDEAAVVDAQKSAALTLNQYRAGTVAYTSVIVADGNLFNAADHRAERSERAPGGERRPRRRHRRRLG